MTRTRTATIILGVILTMPIAGIASGQSSASPLKPATTTPIKGAPRTSSSTTSTPAAMHAVHGVVKSIDPTRLVIAEQQRGKRAAKDVTFMLDSATERQGTVAVGEKVTVRYRTARGANHAAAIVVEAKSTTTTPNLSPAPRS